MVKGIEQVQYLQQLGLQGTAAAFRQDPSNSETGSGGAMGVERPYSDKKSSLSCVV